MLTTIGLPAAFTARTPSRICSEAVLEPPGEFTRRTTAFTPSASAASRRAADSSSDSTMADGARGLLMPPTPVRIGPSASIRAMVWPPPSSGVSRVRA